ncbi:LapA family protein [bacterium]|nr:LapA family protein [bacterium]
MKRLQLILTLIISLLAAAVILQNTLPMEITFLFWKATLPAAVWLIIALLAGFAAGVTAALFRRTGRRKTAADTASIPGEGRESGDADGSAPAA